MKAYKVLKRIDGKLESCQIRVFQGGIHYKKNTLNKPIVKGSLLLCFKELGDAVNFCTDLCGFGSNTEIWEVNIGKVKKLPAARLYTYNCRSSTIDDLWNKGTNHIYTPVEQWPQGSIGVTSVRLVKKCK